MRATEELMRILREQQAADTVEDLDEVSTPVKGDEPKRVNLLWPPGPRAVLVDGARSPRADTEGQACERETIMGIPADIEIDLGETAAGISGTDGSSDTREEHRARECAQLRLDPKNPL